VRLRDDRLRALTRAMLLCGLAFGVALSSPFTFAQSRSGAGKLTRAASKKPKMDAGPSGDLDADAGNAYLTIRGEVASRHGVGEDSGAGIQGAVIEQKTLDGGAKVFRFGEVDIEGRLKSPQLVYFLRRVRAEFAAEDLGHRTFMRELSDTRTDPSF
jgi:hypothetical protein